MPRVMAPPQPAECPWGGYTPPNVDWCEEQLCAVIVNPADTWSNLLFVVLGAVMWRQTRTAIRSQRPVSESLGLFGPSAVAVGIFSFAYHASYTYMLQFFDFVGMFLFCGTVITAAALRLGWIEPRARLPFFFTGVGVLSALVAIVAETSFPIQAIVAVLIAIILGQEALLRARAVRDGVALNYRYFLIALALMAAAGAASLADVSRTWCDPTNHLLQGHSVWHLLSALSLYALYHFYAGLPVSQPGKAASV